MKTEKMYPDFNYRPTFFRCVLFTLLYSEVKGQQTMKEQTKIKITIGETVVTGTLNDTKSSQDLISLLPLTLTMEDYVSTEKISYLPRKLSTEGAPSGFDPSVGDITYYAPWGNLALFYGEAGYANGLVSLGKLDSNISALKAPGKVQVKIERNEK